MSNGGVPVGDLLIHAGFVSGLARELVRDVHAAEDLAQEAWLRALRHPPRSAASMRGWFATLLQNLRRNRDRGERRRRAREANVPPPDVAPSAEQILEREHVRERLVRAVLRLDEPFRTAVLLRYYEELPAAGIARRLGVPAATVRTRLARGLARLREALDEDRRGARAWAVPLSTWVKQGGAGAAASIAAGIAMKKIVFAAAAAVLLAFALAVSSRDDPAPAASRTEASLAAGAEAHASEAPLQPQREVVGAAGPVLDVAAVPAFAIERGVGAVHGDVVDQNDDPVPGIEVIAEPVVGTLPPRFQLRDDRSGRRSGRTDAGGRFRIDGVASGPTRVRAVLDGWRRAAVHTTIADGVDEGPLLLRARSPDPGDWLRVTVVDREDRPVPGAAVEVHGWSSSESFASRTTDPRTDPLASGVADAAGIFELRGGSVRAAVVHARADGAVGMAAFDTWTRNHEGQVAVRVVVASAGSLHGTFTGPGSESLDGATLSLHAQPQLGSYYWGGGRRFDARVSGRAFRFDGLPAGKYSVTLAASSGVRLVTGPLSWHDGDMPNSARVRIVTVAAGEACSVELPVAAGGRLRGTVRSDSRPVAGARVRAVLAPPSPNYPPGVVVRGAHVWRFDRGWEGAPNDPMTHVEVRTGGTGAYELCSLQPGRYRVEVVANGLSFDRRMDIGVEDGNVTELRHDLVAAGVLQFAGSHLSWAGVTAVGETTPAMLAIVDREFVTFPGLAPGRYEIAQFHSDSRVEPVVLATAEVLAGRTTWVDLRATGAVMMGRVTSGGEPVVGATVSLDSVSQRTDAFGMFRLAFGRRPSKRPSYAPGITVSRHGIEATFLVPTTDDVTLELGRRHVTIDAVDEAGGAVAVAVELQTIQQERRTDGLRSCSVERSLPAQRGTRIGPLPDALLHGTVVFEGGVRVPLSMPSGTDASTVVRPATGIVRLQVLRSAEASAADITVDAWTWRGAGEPPADDREIREGEGRLFRTARTDERGVVEFAVAAGEVFLSILSDSATRRLSVAPGTTTTVMLTVP